MSPSTSSQGGGTTSRCAYRPVGGRQRSVGGSPTTSRQSGGKPRRPRSRSRRLLLDCAARDPVGGGSYPCGHRAAVVRQLGVRLVDARGGRARLSRVPVGRPAARVRRHPPRGRACRGRVRARGCGGGRDHGLPPPVRASSRVDRRPGYDRLNRDNTAGSLSLFCRELVLGSVQARTDLPRNTYGPEVTAACLYRMSTAPVRCSTFHERRGTRRSPVSRIVSRYVRLLVPRDADDFKARVARSARGAISFHAISSR